MSSSLFIRKKEIDELTVNTKLIRGEVSTEATESVQPQSNLAQSPRMPRQKITREMIERLGLLTEEDKAAYYNKKRQKYSKMDLL